MVRRNNVITIISCTHIIKMFASKLSMWDLFVPVLYNGYKGSKENIPFYYSRIIGHSCVNDLSKPMDEIMAGMKSNTRNEIRRAEKEGVIFSSSVAKDDFIKMYNEFCASKGLDDFTSIARISKYKDLLLTQAIHDGRPLAMHASVLDHNGKLAFLLYSCSRRLSDGVDRKMIGWANRYLHYKELELLKECGYEIYDWSGVCLDKTNPKYSIGQFKTSFGGDVIESVVLRSPMFVFFESLRSGIKRLLSIFRKGR